MIVGDQSAIIALLADPKTWGAGVTKVERIDTHGAVVFLAGARALKLKRAVRFAYMDFSTPERRWRFCEAEVRLNRRTAPAIYRGVVAVTREADGRLALGGTGEPVDWLVDMRRFDDSTLFDRLAERRRLTPELVEAAAEAIADLHLAAEQRTDHGGIAVLRRVIDGNGRELEQLGRGALDATRVTALHRESLAHLERHAPLIEARRQTGLVRQAHGDLHLHNICLVDDRPTLFDCIEFNDDFAVIDVLYDLSFLLMDLEHRGLRPLANRVLNRWLAWLGDIAGLALLPLYLSSRAAIRAHVSLSMAEVQPDPAAAAALRAEAAVYLDSALAYLRPPPPVLIAVGGLSGSGKSTLAQALAPAIGPSPGAVVARSDLIRKELLDVPATRRLGDEAYTPEITARVYAEMRARAEAALAAGHAAILDAVHARPAERDAAAAIARRAGVPFQGLWLDVPAEVMVRRIAARRADASDATVAVLERQLGYDTGAITWTRLPAAAGPDETLTAARAAFAGGT